MSNVATYTVIRDAIFTLSHNEHRSFTFDVANNMIPSKGASQAILSFTYVPHHAHNLDLQVFINGHRREHEHGITENVLYHVSEPFESNLLHPHGTNKIEFKVAGGSGKLNIQNVVIWYQVPS